MADFDDAAGRDRRAAADALTTLWTCKHENAAQLGATIERVFTDLERGAPEVLACVQRATTDHLAQRHRRAAREPVRTALVAVVAGDVGTVYDPARRPQLRDTLATVAKALGVDWTAVLDVLAVLDSIEACFQRG